VEDKWYTGATTVELTATDELCGVKATYYSIDGAEFSEGTSISIETEGVHTLTFYSIDNAGNVEDKHTVEVKVDKTAPVTVSNVEDKWYTEATTVELTATDAQSGVKATYYSIDGAEFSEGTSIAIETEGIHTITFYSVDNAGNIEDMQTVEVKIDKTAPTIKADFEAEYALGTVLDLNFEAADQLSGIKETSVEVNGVVNTTGKLTLDKPGVYTIKLTATDNAGLKTVVEKTITVFIQATIEVLPRVIKGNKGEFMVKATLPKGLTFSGVDLSTATLNNVHALMGSKGLENQAKKGQFKFERADFVWDEKEERVELRVMVDGYLVVGSTTVEVINNEKEDKDCNKDRHEDKDKDCDKDRHDDHDKDHHDDDHDKNQQKNNNKNCYK
jgi:large repetitive protein